MNASEIVALLTAHRYACVTEGEFQDAVAEVLRRASLVFEREVTLGGGDRIDFLVDGGIGLELKTQGTPIAIARQLQRYARHDRIVELVLVTTRAVHQIALSVQRSFGGKPLFVARVQGGLL